MVKIQCYPGVYSGSAHDMVLTPIKQRLRENVQQMQHIRVVFDIEILKDPYILAISGAMIGGIFGALFLVEIVIEKLVETFGGVV